MKRILSLLALSIPLLWSCDDKPSAVTGTNDETTTSLGVIYRPDGRPAAGARVLIYAAGDTQTTPRVQGIVDDAGHVSLNGRLAAGSWNLLIRNADGTALFQDSLPCDGSKLTVLSDTLRRTGTVKGRIRVQPQDKPTIAWVQLLGAGRYANVDDSGHFAFDSVPSGRLTLAALTLQSQYTPTFRAAPLRPDSILDLGTIDLIYTGVPMVTGVKAKWDSSSNVVTLTWDSTSAPGILGYRIYRGQSSAPFDATEMTYVTSGRSWIDTLFQKGNLGNRFDSLSTSLYYRVMAVTNNSNGPMSFADSLEIRSPVMTGAWSPSWTALGSLPAGCIAESIDSLGTGLGCLATPLGKFPRAASLWESPDGKSWRKVTDSALSDGVFWKGSHYWVTGHLSGRTTSIKPTELWLRSYPDTLLPVFDSLLVHRYDGSTTRIIRVAVQDSLVTHSVLQPFGDLLLLVESRLLVHPMAHSLYDELGSLHSTKEGMAWDDLPWMSDSSRTSVKTLMRLRLDRHLFGGGFQFAPIGDSILITSLGLDNWAYAYTVPTQPFPSRISASGVGSKIPNLNLLAPYSSNLFFTTTNGQLRRAPRSDLSDWHHVGSPNLGTRRLLPWRGLLLVADDTALRASSPIPASF